MFNFNADDIGMLIEALATIVIVLVAYVIYNEVKWRGHDKSG